MVTLRPTLFAIIAVISSRKSPIRGTTISLTASTSIRNRIVDVTAATNAARASIRAQRIGVDEFNEDSLDIRIQ